MTKINSFKFVHAADLHLDSPFKGITTDNEAIGKILHSATFDAFDALINLCIKEQVNFLLIAGDVYDGFDRSLRAQLKFRDGLARLAGHNIYTFVDQGNHDPANSQSAAIEWPDKVHIFDSSKAESKIFNGENNDEPTALISGISHGKSNEIQNLTKKFSRKDAGIFHIGLLHCNTGSNTGHDPYAPCELSELIELGMEYWALGHVHERKILSTDPYVVYSGNTQGRNIREQGERGCYLVSVRNMFVEDIRFCALDAVRWLRVDVNIENMETIDELEKALYDNIIKICVDSDNVRAFVLRVNINGSGSLYKELQKENTVQDLLEHMREFFISDNPYIWVQGMNVNCRPEIDMEILKKRGDFLSQVLKIADNINVQETDAATLIKPVLSDLFENRRIKEVLAELSQDEMDVIVQRAALLCVDILEGKE